MKQQFVEKMQEAVAASFGKGHVEVMEEVKSIKEAQGKLEKRMEEGLGEIRQLYQGLLEKLQKQIEQKEQMQTEQNNEEEN
jgi:hypothetical protein